MAAGMPYTAPSSFIVFIILVCLVNFQLCVYASENEKGPDELLGSRSCIKRIESTRDDLGDGCVTPVCGPLSMTGDPFEEQLTPSCKAVMDKYTPKDLSSLWAGGSLAHPQACKNFAASLHPTNPVVIQTETTGSFGFCSVPKAGCSQFRSLLFVMTRYPDAVSWIGAMWKVHMQSYPSLYHYDTPHPLPSSFPLFILGRSPYTRLLSGFLDKMTIQDRGNDIGTLTYVNRNLGRGEAEFFENSKESFRDFLVQLIAVMREGKHVNEHFAPMVSVCNVREVSYNYFLRLEEMAQWMPCLREGLHLGKFTDLGWDPSRILRSDWYEPRRKGCWWRPKGISCQQYEEQSRDFVAGYRSSIDVQESVLKSGSDADVHSTSADDKWQLYYDQEIADMVYEAYKIDFEAFGYDRLVM